MKGKIRSTRFWYDVTHEMRRYALAGKLEELFPRQATSMLDTLLAGGRIVFSPDEEEYYQELEVDRILHDPQTGKTRGARRL